MSFDRDEASVRQTGSCSGSRSCGDGGGEGGGSQHPSKLPRRASAIMTKKTPATSPASTRRTPDFFASSSIAQVGTKVHESGRIRDDGKVEMIHLLTNPRRVFGGRIMIEPLRDHHPPAPASFRFAIEWPWGSRDFIQRRRSAEHRSPLISERRRSRPMPIT